VGWWLEQRERKPWSVGHVEGRGFEQRHLGEFKLHCEAAVCYRIVNPGIQTPVVWGDPFDVKVKLHRRSVAVDLLFLISRPVGAIKVIS
jgi:hypothetical protein